MAGKERRVRTIKMMPLASITPYGGNARIHTEEQVELIAESITENGFTNPIEVDEDGVIIAGHGRREAAVFLGLEKVPVVVIDWLTETQKAKLRLTDNRLAELSDWDPIIVASELMELGSADESFSGMDVSMDDKFLKKLGIGEDEKDSKRKKVDEDKQEYLLIIACTDELEQQELHTEFSERGLSVKIME